MIPDFGIILISILLIFLQTPPLKGALHPSVATEGGPRVNDVTTVSKRDKGVQQQVQQGPKTWLSRGVALGKTGSVQCLGDRLKGGFGAKATTLAIG